LRKILTIVFLCALLTGMAFAQSGLITVKSAHDVKTTADRLEKVLKEKGMTVFARIDHALGAQKAGKTLPPTELIIFGNPKVGTPLMQCNRTVAIDLPQKALVWQDAEGRVWLTYNDPHYLMQRHKLNDCKKVIEKITGALANFVKIATQPEQTKK